METSLILTALVVLAISGVLVAAMMARSRRPELRMSREEDLEVDGKEALIRSLEPPRISPIDRSAPVLEIEPVMEHDTRRLPPGGEGR